MRTLTLHDHTGHTFTVAADRILRVNATERGSQVWLGRMMDRADKVNVQETVEEIARMRNDSKRVPETIPNSIP